jgi:hypothetical protein
VLTGSQILVFWHKVAMRGRRSSLVEGLRRSELGRGRVGLYDGIKQYGHGAQ